MRRVADLLNRVRQPFNVNSLAQAAALAALDDTEYVDESRVLNREGMRPARGGFAALGLAYAAVARQLRARRRSDDARARQRGAAAAGRHRAPGRELRPAEWLRVTVGTAARRTSASSRRSPSRSRRATGGARAHRKARRHRRRADRRVVRARVARAPAPSAQVVGVGRSRGNLDRALARGVIDRGVMLDDDWTREVRPTPISCSSRSRRAVPRDAVARWRRSARRTRRRHRRGQHQAGRRRGRARNARRTRLPQFVPAHPIAGSERSGADAGDASLLRRPPGRS